MKKRAVLIMGLAIVAVSFQCNALTGQRSQVLKAGATTQYPETVKKVIDSKCLGCHSPEGKSEKAKEALNWMTLMGLEKSVKVSKLDKIVEVLDKGEMPPKKMLEMHPEAKISAEDSKILRDWAVATSDVLMK